MPTDAEIEVLARALQRGSATADQQRAASALLREMEEYKLALLDFCVRAKRTGELDVIATVSALRDLPACDPRSYPSQNPSFP